MTLPIEVTVALAKGATIIGFVFEQNGLWFRRPGADARWHLTKPGLLRSWCGIDYRAKNETMTVHVTWPWISRGCWSCMDRRWSKGIR